MNDQQLYEAERAKELMDFNNRNEEPKTMQQLNNEQSPTYQCETCNRDMLQLESGNWLRRLNLGEIPSKWKCNSCMKDEAKPTIDQDLSAHGEIITKERCLKLADMEGDETIGAGSLPQLTQPPVDRETLSNVKLQHQPTRTTCVHTCLAMLMGVPVQEVISRIGDCGCEPVEVLVFLHRFGISFAPIATPKLWDGWHLVAVPSLNVEGGAHAILVSWNHHAGELIVKDPSPWKSYASNGSNLHLFFDVILVRPGGSLEYFDRKPTP